MHALPVDLFSNASNQSPIPKRRKRSERPPLSFRTPRTKGMAYERPVTPVTPEHPSYYDLRSTQPATSRRSVINMKTLLPLRLASPVQSPQASPTVRSSPEFSVKDSTQQARSEQATPVPWMDTPTSILHMTDIKRDRYRETPIYSEPNSPMLARAYFNDQDLCRSYSNSRSSCSDPCLRRNSKETATEIFDGLYGADDCAKSSDHHEESGSDCEGSVSTAPTSVIPIECELLEQFSMCRDLFNRHVPSPVASPIAPESESFSPSILLAPKFKHLSWSDDGSSRCSSPDSMVEFAEASLTPLAPAKPQVIRVNTTGTLPRRLFPPRKSSLASPVSPAGWLSRSSTLDATSRAAAIGTILQQPPKRKARPAALDDLTPRAKIPRNENDTSQPKVAPLSSPFDETFDYKRSAPRFKFEVHDVAEEVLCLPLIESICDTIDGSPRDLQLDSYCVTEIRRLNRQARFTSNLALAQPYNLDQQMTPDTPKTGSRTRSIFGSLRQSRTNVFPSRVSALPAPLKTSRGYTPSGSGTKPDLEAFRNIFPGTDDWWRSVLYAHLLAFNYVSSLQSRHCQSRPSSSSSSLITSFPRKATLTLGLPVTPSNSMESHFNAYVSTDREVEEEQIIAESFQRILEALASCITRIISCMKLAGDLQAARERVQEKWAPQVDWILVRSLAEIVRCAEAGPR